MKRLDYYWRSNKEWYHWDEEKAHYIVNNDAPDEAKESYNHYLEQLKENNL